jgi:hypothetical protein
MAIVSSGKLKQLLRSNVAAVIAATVVPITGSPMSKTYRDIRFCTSTIHII